MCRYLSRFCYPTYCLPSIILNRSDMSVKRLHYTTVFDILSLVVYKAAILKINEYERTVRRPQEGCGRVDADREDVGKVSSGFEYFLLTFAQELGSDLKLLGQVPNLILYRMVYSE